MIPRYSRQEMVDIWAAENKFRIWLDIEIHICEAQEKLGVIPKGVAKALKDRGNFDVARIDEIEKDVKHDVIAFLTSVAEHVGEESRYVHQGVTSSDIIDTAFAVQMKQSGEIMLKDLDRLLAALKKRSLEHKDTLCIGRSHGIHAEPTTFGLKLSGHYAAFQRNKDRLKRAIENISVCAISGAVGTYSTIDPSVQAHVAKKMGLSAETISTQVIPRDRHAEFFAALAITASSIENLAIEIRHLQRSEVREAEEFFAKGQKGSSAMPHKRNPVLTENLTGLARVVRSHVIPALENVALWHERDISHSSVERMIGPDACITLDFALNRLAGVIENLLIYPKTMKANLEKLGGLVFSQRVLLALTQAGVSREDAYLIVQRNAMKVWECDAKTDFYSFLSKDKDVKAVMDAKKLKSIFDYAPYTKHISTLIKKTLK